MTILSGRGLHGQVVNSLGARIVQGDFGVGTLLDPDKFMEEFQVSRTVIRESLKVLTAKGLVDARPKIGTTVAPRSQWQLLDVDIMRWRTVDRLDARLVTELDEVRAVFEPAAAAMAAEHRTPEQLETMEAALDRLEKAATQRDEREQVESDVAFHLAVLAACGNELLHRFEVVLAPALYARHELATRHAVSDEFIAQHRVVYDAIARGDAPAARLATEELVARSAQEIAGILGADQA